MGKISGPCKAAAKRKFKVWPSAYASGWGVRCTKAGGPSNAGRAGKYKRSSKTNVKGARKKGATLRDWFEKENWINIKTGRPCGESTKKKK